MRKLIIRVGICVVIVAFVGICGLLFDNYQLKNSLIRFHVVANSNSSEDQGVKLLVRDAVIQSIQEDLAGIADVDQARAYLEENLTKIQDMANRVLKKAGFDDSANVSLCKEAFSTRRYDTFTLPAGIYEALRIVIGEGEGQNWWCVAFPALCIPATNEGFSENAVEAGLSPQLTQTLKPDTEYEIRFFILDTIGWIENSLFKN